ncbi:MAG: cation-efflux pump [Vulcanimicrobiota bacterium]
MKWDEKMVAAAVSVASNTILVLCKIVIGIITGSVSIISEAAHSGLDLLASLIAFFAVKEVRKPADREHPFGHGKIENFSGTVEALLILFASVFIIHEAIGKLVHGGEVEQLGLGVIVMGVSTVMNIGVSIFLFKVAKKTNSLALEADAEHLRTDVFTSLGVMLALAVIHFTRLTILDPIVAIVVAIYIGIIAIRLTKKAFRDLVDSRLSENEESQIKAVLDGLPELKGYHNFRSRRSGNDRFVDFHILVSERMDLKDAHDLTRKIKASITTILANTNVTIHVEPCQGNCQECNQHCREKESNLARTDDLYIPGEKELEQQVQQILKETEGVIGAHEIHLHRLTGLWEVQIDLIVPPTMMVSEGHDTALKVEEALRNIRKDLGKVTIHVEPEGHRDIVISC